MPAEVRRYRPSVVAQNSASCTHVTRKPPANPNCTPAPCLWIDAIIASEAPVTRSNRRSRACPPVGLTRKPNAPTGGCFTGGSPFAFFPLTSSSSRLKHDTQITPRMSLLDTRKHRQQTLCDWTGETTTTFSPACSAPTVQPAQRFIGSCRPEPFAAFQRAAHDVTDKLPRSGSHWKYVCPGTSGRVKYSGMRSRWQEKMSGDCITGNGSVMRTRGMNDENSCVLVAS
jgi:hypothetical protein